MLTEQLARLFDRDAHNPSIRSIEANLPARAQPIDFCVPVNGYFPPASLIEELCQELPNLIKFYPDYADVHQKNLAAVVDLPPENIVVANGSTELITLLCLEHSGPLASCAPTFGRWTDLPRQQGSDLHLIIRKADEQFQLSAERIVSEVRQSGSRKLVLSNPNNPTGAANSLDDIAWILKELSDLDLIVIDESFIDFSGVSSAASLVINHPNSIVVKSLGKSLGWHGIRLGYAIANAESASRLRNKVPYWNINGVAAFVLERLPALQTEYRQSFRKAGDDRKFLFDQLQDVNGLTPYPSQANFVYVRLPDHIAGKPFRDELLTRFGLLIRECSNKLGSSEQYLRIAVHRQQHTQRLAAAMAEIFGDYRNR